MEPLKLRCVRHRARVQQLFTYSYVGMYYFVLGGEPLLWASSVS
jgi:hypothetical protein